MIWYWKLLIVIGYLLIWALTTFICMKFFETASTGVDIFLGLIWPLSLPLMAIALIGEGIGLLVGFLVDLIKGRR